MAEIKSSDGRRQETYVFTIKQNVSAYDKLKNLTIDEETPCTLYQMDDEGVPTNITEFDPNVTHYYCSWWWQNSPRKNFHELFFWQKDPVNEFYTEDDKKWEERKYGAVIPHLDHKKCPKCQILAPDVDDVHTARHLSYRAGDEKRYPWDDGEKWRRMFVYGEKHHVPFQVVAADQFTSKTYWVTFERKCPWWMATKFTRDLSSWATLIAFVLAASSGVTNMMALAKFVQFMGLTCEIDGVPKVYQDFSDGLSAFSFDAFGWIPWQWFGIPTHKDIQNMKQNMIDKLKEELDIKHATLLIQYCFTRSIKPDA